MSFPPIHEPSDPEEYSWEVTLQEGQSLKSVDSQSAEVLYEAETVAFLIQAEAAHDAQGATVPTTLAVTVPNIVTLIVHHRAGNPAAANAPFAYPVTAGAGWEGGFQTEIVKGPEDEAEVKAREERERIARREREAAQLAKAAERCLVPRLKGISLEAARKKLKAADCTLGKVRGHRTKTAKVVKQNPRPGNVLSPGAKVNVKLGG
jgi:hypothetical protein